MNVMGSHTFSLYQVALNHLCRTMDENTLELALESCPTTVFVDIVYKLLNINRGSEEFAYNHINSDGERSAIIRGRSMALMEFQSHSFPFMSLDPRNFKIFAKTQQTYFVDGLHLCIRFNITFFFKLVDIIQRSQLFTIFQICVQNRGVQLPNQLAFEWICSTTQKNKNKNITDFEHIEQGLKLGIFLGDSGWFRESALVLSCTYKIITTEWLCLDEKLKLVKIIQCLTKWLFVLSSHQDVVEGKKVLKLLLSSIDIVEQIEGRTLCIPNAYVAVSQYYFVLMEYNEAWSWAVKAVNELKEECADLLKMLVISHMVRVSAVFNKLSTAKKLIDQLHTYDQPIDENMHVDMLMNEACYSLVADLADDSVSSYYIALDSMRNLFGYYNLKTAIVFVDYAYARYICNYSSTDFDEALRCILQGIHIMQKIGVSENSLLFVNAGRIKALIHEEVAMDYGTRNINMFVPHYQENDIQDIYLRVLKPKMLKDAEDLHLKALKTYKNAVGENTLLVSRSYSNLGRLYQSQGKYITSEEMHLTAIRIKESILGVENPAVAISLGHLASLYTYQMRKYQEAEELYLRSKRIYETAYGGQYTGLLYDFQGLAEVYLMQQDMVKYHQYVANLMGFLETREQWLKMVHTSNAVNCTNNNLSLEKFKCILNGCAC